MNLLGLAFSDAMRNDVGGHAVAFGGVGHVEFEKDRVADGAWLFAFGLSAHSLHNLRCDSLPEKRRHGVSDLPESVPFSYVEPEPVRVGMQPGSLSDRNTSW